MKGNYETFNNDKTYTVKLGKKGKNMKIRNNLIEKKTSSLIYNKTTNEKRYD